MQNVLEYEKIGYVTKNSTGYCYFCNNINSVIPIDIPNGFSLDLNTMPVLSKHFISTMVCSFGDCKENVHILTKMIDNAEWNIFMKMRELKKMK
jgi:hypothetical protein